MNSTTLKVILCIIKFRQHSVLNNSTSCEVWVITLVPRFVTPRTRRCYLGSVDFDVYRFFNQHAVTRDKNTPYGMMTNKQSKHRYIFQGDISTGVTRCDMKMNDRRLANTPKYMFSGICNDILLPGIRLIISYNLFSLTPRKRQVILGTIFSSLLTNKGVTRYHSSELYILIN